MAPSLQCQGRRAGTARRKTSMRINDENGFQGSTPVKGVQSQKSQPVTGRAPSSEQDATVSSGSDRVSLSNLIDRVSQTLRSDSASRTEHVNQITQAVRNGTYQVDGAAVGRALIDQSLTASRGQRG